MMDDKDLEEFHNWEAQATIAWGQERRRRRIPSIPLQRRCVFEGVEAMDGWMKYEVS